MNVIKVNLPFNDNHKSENLILGHFNVVHKGHYNLFNKLNDYSFMIFENNPSKLNTLYTLEERINNLKRFNPQNIFVYDILKYNLDSVDFVEQVLKKIKFKNLIVGSDFVFGKNRNGNIDLLKKYFNVLVTEKDGIFSTSTICNLLENGEIEKANQMLLHNFYYENYVVQGKGLARKLFKPTANIIDNKIVDLKSGSYVSITMYENKFYKSISFIGIPKSFEDNRSFVETHIFDFDKDIYSEKIRVYPIHFIRENQKFNDIKDLEKSIKNDFEKAINYFDTFDWNKFRP